MVLRKESTHSFIKEACEKFISIIQSAQWKVFDDLSRAGVLFGLMLSEHALRMDDEFKLHEKEFREILESWKSNSELSKLGGISVVCAGFGQGLGRSGIKDTARIAIDLLLEIGDFLEVTSFSTAAYSLYHMGSTAHTIGDTSLAIHGFSRALKIARSSGMDSLAGKSCYHLGRLHLEADKIDNANYYLNLCLRLYPSHRKARIILEEINNKVNT